MGVIIVVVLGLLFVLKLLWKYCVVAPIKDIKGGYKHDIILPHTEPIELYFADISTMSMKVRFCLAVAGIKFKPHLKRLPSAGSFETKTPEYLNINPAGTVPVLLHNGHPIYESSDQIQYIANKLISNDGPVLLPTDPNEKLVNKYWIGQTSMYVPEISVNMETGLKRRPGNCIPIISLPCFAMIARTLSWKTLLYGLLIRGCDKKQILSILFAIFGVQTFKYIPIFARMVKLAKKELFGHLTELEKFLKGKGTKYICGNNITLADISWAPILERMDLAGWWEHIDPNVYPCVLKYWKDMKSLPSYQEATRPIEMEETFLTDMKSKITQWKLQYPWFKKIYV